MKPSWEHVPLNIEKWIFKLRKELQLQNYLSQIVSLFLQGLVDLQLKKMSDLQDSVYLGKNKKVYYTTENTSKWQALNEIWRTLKWKLCLSKSKNKENQTGWSSTLLTVSTMNQKYLSL